jgi:acetoin:2,6-dichlorophenolindophenol oxidoreductase subunit alpha
MTGGAGASVRAESIGVPGVKVDGNDVESVHAAASRLVAEVRSGKGPRFLHAVTYRFKGHVSVDTAAYRDAAEVARALESDPLLLARGKLVSRGMAALAIDAIDVQAKAEIDAALAAAEAAPWPDTDSAYTDIQDTGAGQWR